MRWNAVEETPLVMEDPKLSRTYDVLVDETFIVEIETSNGPVYYIGSIGDSLQIEDGCGVDLGYSALDVTRWAVFEPPSFK